MRRQPSGFQSATAREKIPPHGAETKRRPKAPLVVRSGRQFFQASRMAVTTFALVSPSTMSRRSQPISSQLQMNSVQPASITSSITSKPNLRTKSLKLSSLAIA